MGGAGHEAFWDFSVRTYRTPGVPEACLSLQNEHSADVNMVLFCCWVGARRGAFDDRLFEAACNFSDQWAGQVVIRLREARTWMKHSGCFEPGVPTEECMRLREDVKKVEFAAEKLQQQVLESLVEPASDRDAADRAMLDDVVANLERYARHAGFGIDEATRDKCRAILEAAFPDCDESVVGRALQRRSSA